MTDFVLDCSVTMAWCFEDETDPYADAILEGLAQSSALVPSLWALEVTNVLLVGERRGRISQPGSVRFLELLSALPIELMDVTLPQASTELMTLGRSHALSAYDAAYLSLALRSDIPLATRDGALRTAASAIGVSLLEAP